MPFKFADNQTVDSLDNVPNDFRSLYVQNDEGKHVIGEAFASVANAIDGLNGANAAVRKNLSDMKARQVDLSSLADFGSTPDEIKTAFDAQIQDLQEQVGKTGKVNVEKIKDTFEKQFKAQITAAETLANGYKAQLQQVLVENAATQAIVANKGDVDLLMPFIRQQVKMVEGEDKKLVAIVVDEQGDTRYNTSSLPMSVSELVLEMKGKERFGKLFESEQKGGGGAAPGSAARRQGNVGNSREKMSSLDKINAGLDAGQYSRGR